MLKNKLARKIKTADEQLSDSAQAKLNAPVVDSTFNSISTIPLPLHIHTSKLFVEPIWKLFYYLECGLNTELALLQPPAVITNIYNPVEYAAEVHCAYLRRYLGNRTKRLLFVGMNPGPNGMAQTGVPFGNISTVRDMMHLKGVINQPKFLHHKRPISGFGCNIEEPSGIRIWKLLARLAGGSLDTFAEQCFVHNFCPLSFFDEKGRNITPSELKGEYKTSIRDKCMLVLDQQIDLLQPEIIVAVGDFVYKCMNISRHKNKRRILKLSHPSPRSLNNQNWPEKAEKMLEENDLLRYFRSV